MSESEGLSDLLERAAERTHVGPPPIEDIVANARRARRLRAAMVSASAALAVVTAVLGVVVLDGGSATTGVVGSDGDATRMPASISPSTSLSIPSTPLPNETSLDGEWTVRALVGTDGQPARPKVTGDRVRLTFTNGRMTGTTGCNRVSGNYQQGGTQNQDLRFQAEQLHSVSATCDDPPLVARLLDVRHVSGSPGVRYLHGENWMIIAELHRTT